MERSLLFNRIYQSVLRLLLFWVVTLCLLLILVRFEYQVLPEVPYVLLAFAVLFEAAGYVDLLLHNRLIPWLMIPAAALLLARGLYVAQRTLERMEGLLWWPAPLLALVGVALLHMVMQSVLVERGLVLLALSGSIWLYVVGVSLPRSLVAGLLILVVTEILGLYGRQRVNWIPYLAVLGIITMLLPVNEKPYDWAFVYKASAAAQSTLRTVSMNLNYYAMQLGLSGDGLPGYSGISGSSRVLGESQVEELYLENVTGRNNLYLTGSVFDDYDGVSFDRAMESEGMDIPYNAWLIDYMQALYANGITPEEARCFSNICSATIRYGYLRTGDMMHPDHLLKVDDVTRRQLRAPEADFVFDGSRQRGFTYEVSYMEFDEENPYLERVMENLPTERENLGYAELSTYFKELYGVDLTAFMKETEYERALQYGTDRSAWMDTSSATQRMQSLAAEITKDCRSDLERARAIEEYLHQYTYDVREDFRGIRNQTDTFLFERQKGYCAQYAASMTMLLRLNGIPARYCSGYRTRSSEGKDGLVVHGSQAHAWTEAWLEGYGWLRFEPTGGSYAVRPPAWNLLVREEDERLEDEGDHYIPSAPPLLPDTEPTAEEREKAREDWHTLLGMAIRLVCILLLYTLLMLWIVRIILQIRYRKKISVEKLQVRVRETKRLIQDMGKENKQHGNDGRSDNQPLSAYVQDLEKILEERGEEKCGLSEQLEALYALYYRVRFGADDHVTDAEWQQVLETRQELLRFYGGQSGRGHLGKEVRSLVIRLYG